MVSIPRNTENAFLRTLILKLSEAISTKRLNSETGTVEIVQVEATLKKLAGINMALYWIVSWYWKTEFAGQIGIFSIIRNRIVADNVNMALPNTLWYSSFLLTSLWRKKRSNFTSTSSIFFFFKSEVIVISIFISSQINSVTKLEVGCLRYRMVWISMGIWAQLFKQMKQQRGKIRARY